MCLTVISRHTGAVIMRIAYGYQKQDDDLVQVVTKCMADAALASSPTSFLVNSLPFRKSSRPFFRNRFTHFELDSHESSRLVPRHDMEAASEDLVCRARTYAQ